MHQRVKNNLWWLYFLHHYTLGLWFPCNISRSCFWLTFILFDRSGKRRTDTHACARIKAMQIHSTSHSNTCNTEPLQLKETTKKWSISDKGWHRGVSQKETDAMFDAAPFVLIREMITEKWKTLKLTWRGEPCRRKERLMQDEKSMQECRQWYIYCSHNDYHKL